MRQPVRLPGVPLRERCFGENAVLLLGLSLILAALGVAVFPCWRYSARWGYGPSATIGLLLFFAGLLAVGGKSSSLETVGDRLDQPQRVVMRRADAGRVTD